MRRKALITGITGQDGSYLTELLLNKGYEIHGIIRRVAVEDGEKRFSRIKHLLDRITLHYGDVMDYPSIWHIIAKVKPDELYHLAAQSDVGVSFKDNFVTFNTNTNSVYYILSALRELKPDCRFYFAGTSEMFGDAIETPQNEKTPFSPVSPYAISKLASYYLVKIHRQAYGLFSCTGILFNHESPRRGFEFVTRKITSSIARIKKGIDKELRLGNLNSKRDWGFAGDYVEAMWLMLQQDEPEDYVIGTDENHSVKEFIEKAFRVAGIEIKWEGEGINEKGINRKSGRALVVVNKDLFRPIDVYNLKADSTKARQKLNWQPKTSFDELIKMMVEADLKN